mmetsp:Transcript_19101/g.55502  ORF Transcript_19101/g.55502 Transcript_19101/m.55502 type:complete len:487 (+) Transcript_19101:344-1804(+)
MLRFVEHPSFLVVRVLALCLESSPQHLLGFHNEEDNKHHEECDTPLSSSHGSHTKDDGVQARDVGDGHLQDGHDGNGVPRELVALEDAGVEGTVVGETSRKGDADRTKVEGVNSLGTELLELYLIRVACTHEGRPGPEDGSNDSKGECGSGERNAQEQVATNEALPDLAGGLVHDAILGGLDGTHESEGDSADQVRVKHLNGSEGSVGETAQDTEEDGHALGIVDRGVHEQDLTEVVPHDTTLTDSNDNGGKVIIGKDHLGSLASDIGTFLAHGNTHIGSLEGRSIIHTISSHGRNLTHCLKCLHDADLVLGTGAGKYVVGHDSFLDLVVIHGIQLGSSDSFRVLLVNNAQHVSNGGGSILVVSSDHGNANSGLAGLGNGLDTLGAGGIHNSAESNHGEPGLIAAIHKFGSELIALVHFALRDLAAGEPNDAQAVRGEGGNLFRPVPGVNVFVFIRVKRSALGLLVTELEHAIGGALGVNNELAVV